MITGQKSLHVHLLTEGKAAEPSGAAAAAAASAAAAAALLSPPLRPLTKPLCYPECLLSHGSGCSCR